MGGDRFGGEEARRWFWLAAISLGMLFMIQVSSPHQYLILPLLIYMIALRTRRPQRPTATQSPSRIQNEDETSMDNTLENDEASLEVLGLRMQLLHLIIDQSPAAVIALDSAERVQLFNATAESMFDLKEKNLLGNPLPEMLSMLQPFLRRGDESAGFTLSIGEGDSRQTLAVTTKTWLDNNGLRAGMLCSISDITSSERLKESALRNERLAAIGQMAAGTVHELRNPLAAARGFVQLLGKVKSPDDFPHEYSELALLEIDRMDQILQEYLLLSKAVLPDLVSLDLTGMLKNTLDLSEGIFAQKRIKLVLLPSPSVPVLADCQYVQHILQHLLYNAVEATPDGGQITVSLQRSGRMAMVEIKDSGPGMDQDELAHCFEPFYSTKEAGVGLGLTVCQRLVEQLGGFLTIDSQLEVGTTVRLSLPTAGS